MFEIDITNHQVHSSADHARLRSAAQHVLREEGIASAAISIAIVDDSTIHELNRRYLQHDYATDVLSFLLERDGDHLDGEVIVSADTAAASAQRFGSAVADELLLYVVHGLLHLVGYDDQTPDDRARMRQRERRCLARFGFRPEYDRDSSAPSTEGISAAGRQDPTDGESAA